MQQDKADNIAQYICAPDMYTLYVCTQCIASAWLDAAHCAVVPEHAPHQSLELELTRARVEDAGVPGHPAGAPADPLHQEEVEVQDPALARPLSAPHWTCL